MCLAESTLLGILLSAGGTAVTEKQPATRTERKRCAILQAAVEEFRANGFQATSMDRIAERAEVSKRTIYNHFESKEVLFQAITDELVDQIVSVNELDYDPSQALEAQLEEIGRRKVALMTCPGFLDLAKVTITEHLRVPELAGDTFCRIHDDENALVRWIRAAVADGRLDVRKPAMAAEQFSALLSAFAFWPLIFGRPQPTPDELEEVVRETIAMFLDHYGADEEAQG